MRFRVRYGVRTASVIVALACIVLAYIGNVRHQYHRQHRIELDALETLEHGGGAVFYFPRQTTLVESSGWHGRLRGERHLANISGVYMGPNCDQNAFAALEGLRTLDIRLAFIEEVDVSAEMLWLSLFCLPKMDTIRITGSNVTGPLPGRFELPRNVRHVRIGNSTADNSFLISISAIPTLQFLGLEGMEIDDDVLQHISTNKGIVFLSLSGSNVTDEGVQRIAGMDMLEQLDLSHTACSDAIVDALLSMPQLQAIDTSGGQITEKGVQRLKNGCIEIGMLVEELKDLNAPNAEQDDARELPIARELNG